MPGFIIFDSGPSSVCFRGDLEVAADVVRDQFLDVLGRTHREVVAQPEPISTFLMPGSARALR
jgi:hypothetical protein